MSSLEELTLAIRVCGRASFVDGIYLHNAVLCHMPQLAKFRFDIISDFATIPKEIRPSADDIRRTFIEKGHHVDCYIDYHEYYSSYGRCHVYSVPFTMDRILQITHNFPGGNFNNVRILQINDHINSFEPAFFARVSHAFPLLNRLTLSIRYEQRRVSEEELSIIEYSHLSELRFRDVHVDYVEQFLSDTKTRLPCLSMLLVKYEQLTTVTEDFTRNATRVNCAKVKSIEFYMPEKTIYSTHIYSYFPLLCDVQEELLQ